MGVGADADQKTIKKAFRRRARETHPDSGGDAKGFARVKRASLVLLDPRKREKYDRTGEVDEEAPDNALSEVMQFVAMAIAEVVGEAVAQRRESEHVDLVAGASQKLRAKLDQLVKTAKELTYQKEYLTRSMARVTVKKGKENRVAGLLKGQLRWIERAEETGKRQTRSIEEALVLLAEHGYTVEKAPAGIAANSVTTFRFVAG